jgi:signal transduction histidine kinase
MKTIKATINSVIFALLLGTLGLSYLAFQDYQITETMQNQISQSLSVRDLVKELNPAKKDPTAVKKLREFKNDLSDSERRHRVSNMIQAYNGHNRNLYDTRVKEFEKGEQDFFIVAQWTIKKFKNSAHFYAVLAMSFPLLGLFWLFYFFNYGLLNPLQGLSQRMMEFLTDQYTFRFSSPANNEIGNLERTFNALAQKVLNNIDELQSLDRAKSEFVSIASHELRTPLTSIKGSLGLLSSQIVGQIDEPAQEMVLIAEQETDRLVRLINDMLDLAKIESRSLTLEKNWVLLDSLLHKTAQGLHGFASTAQVEIRVENPLGEDCEVLMDSDRIQQVITNLISNAIKFSPPGSHVDLSVNQLLDGPLEISITDQGPGISEENQGLIFEKFRQATGPSNHLVKGTGLGLAISKALIEEHEGLIGVRSQQGLGSTFYFTLPQWRKISHQQQCQNEAA